MLDNRTDVFHSPVLCRYFPLFSGHLAVEQMWLRTVLILINLLRYSVVRCMLF